MPHFQARDGLYDTTWMDNGDTTGLSLVVCWIFVVVSDRRCSQIFLSLRYQTLNTKLRKLQPERVASSVGVYLVPVAVMMDWRHIASSWSRRI
ncbi:hypothetical protein BJX64DRAFT_219546 [Aspergillus heterothallicus]